MSWIHLGALFIYIWQHPDWPQWKFDGHALVVSLAQTRQQQGIVIGKAKAIGLANVNLTQVVNDIWVQEVMATAAIEGEKLDHDMRIGDRVIGIKTLL